MWQRDRKSSLERLLNIGKKELKTISKNLFCENGKYEKWMRYYFNPKTFYSCKSIIDNRKSDDIEIIVFKKLETLLFTLFTECQFSQSELELFIYERGLIFTLLLICKFNPNKLAIEKAYREFLGKIFLILRLKNSKLFLGSKTHIANCLFNLKIDEEINFIMPVCPDYEYKINNEGKKIYTFNNVGSGIGLVAEKSISSLTKINAIAKSLSLTISNEILIGDFEANEANCKRLGISKTEFFKRMRTSCTRYKEISNTDFYSGLFTERTITFEGWERIYNKIKFDFFNSVDNFDKLYKLFPEIDHKRIFNIRLSMYKRWFPDSDNIFQVFISQIIEYIIMGNIIKFYYKNPILITSDHFSMAPYYSAMGGCMPLSTHISYS